MFGYNAGVKEPAYTSVLKDGAYEVREYSKIVMITAFSEGDFKQSQNQSFNKLFDYISGQNMANKEIPMTAPVVMKNEGQKIPMTAPVLMEGQKSGWAMSFVLPQDYTLETAPRPLDPSLKLEERTGVKYAVVQFSGFFSEQNFEDRSAQLTAWIEKNNLKPLGPPLRAGYNPPWTLPPLKRNEVLIPVE